MTVTLLVLTAVVAVVDWVAVDLGRTRVEFVAKPLTLALLFAAAAVGDLGPAQPWVLAGLVLGLAGDIALMLSDKGRTDPPFLLGLGSFLLGHLAYLIGFLRHGTRGIDVAAGLLIVLGAFALVMPVLLRGAAARAGTTFAGIVAGYGVALGVMAVAAAGTGVVAVAVGGVLFLASDSLLGYQRFVRTVPHGDVGVIVTYHAAQFLFVVGLLR
ncbi:MAG: lysoplasmalogenase family protein [Jatrophihabitans sp.]|uniref:lysoplasmalogenase family protein n=1 Tax=Jatrophihabitans sp. TaxID=1932789 RepID=UPI003F7FCB1B